MNRTCPDRSRMRIGETPFEAAAKLWVEKEEAYYQRGPGKTSSYHPKTKGPVTKLHLTKATEEFARRFSAITVEADQEQCSERNQDPKSGTRKKNGASSSAYGAPFLLVCSQVPVDWTPPEDFSSENRFRRVRFLVVPNIGSKDASLFITFMPGSVHGYADGYVSDQLCDWVRDNKLGVCLGKNQSGGNQYQPDISLAPVLKDPNPDPDHPDSDPNSDGNAYRRIVVEIEYAHRNAEGLRTVGREAFRNPYTSLFLGIKLWKKSNTGFGAAAILWGKDPNQTISLLQAVDFGTRELSNDVKARFSEPAPAGVDLLPAVMATNWIRSELPENYALPAFGDPPPPSADGSLTLPCSHLLHRVTYRDAPHDRPYILQELSRLGSPARDMVLNLHYFAFYLNEMSWPPEQD